MSDFEMQQMVEKIKEADAFYNDLSNSDESREQARRDIIVLQQAIQAKQNSPQTPVESGGIVENVSDFGRGIGHGMRDMYRSGKELGIRFIGDDNLEADRLDRLNAQREQTRLDTQYLRERSPWAYGGGKLLGEGIATLPAGGAGGFAAKGLVGLGGKLVLGRGLTRGTALSGGTFLAGEGAGAGAFYSGGDESMATQAGVGAVAGPVLGGAIKVAGGALGPFFRNRYRMMRGTPQDRVDTLTNPQRIQERVDAAKDYGGYDLDPATASGTGRALQALDQLRNSPASAVAQGMRTAEANVERQVHERARDVATLWGALPNIDPDSRDFQEAGRLVQQHLDGLRKADEQQFKSMYRQFDAMRAGQATPFEPASLNQKIIDLDRSGQTLNKKMMDEIDLLLENYSIRPIRQEPLPTFPTRAQARAPGRTPDNDLTFENVESLIQELNAVSNNVSLMGNIGNGQNYIKNVKAVIDGHVDEIFDAMDGSGGVAQLGRQARIHRRSFSDKWESGDILERLTALKNDNTHRMDFNKSLKNIGTEDLQELKTRLGIVLNEKGAVIKSGIEKDASGNLTGSDSEVAKNIWETMQAAPLLDAFAQATSSTTGGVTRVMDDAGNVFNNRKFATTFNSHVKGDKAEILYGGSRVEEMNKTFKAWNLRHVRPADPAKINVSDSAWTALRSLRFAPAGIMRNFSMVLAGTTGVVANKIRAGMDARDFAELQAGNIPQSITADMYADAMMELEEKYLDSSLARFMGALNMSFRTGSEGRFSEQFDQ